VALFWLLSRRKVTSKQGVNSEFNVYAIRNHSLTLRRVSRLHGVRRVAVLFSGEIVVKGVSVFEPRIVDSHREKIIFSLRLRFFLAAISGFEGY